MAGIKISGGALSNSASVSGYNYGVRAYASASYITNSGAITATAVYGIGVELDAGGTVDNLSGGTIDGGTGRGVYAEGSTAAVTNAGDISGAGGGVWLVNGDNVSNLAGGSIVTDGSNASAVFFGPGGQLDNAVGASIEATGNGDFGVRSNGPATVTNEGYIGATGQNVSGVYFNGGSLTNTGKISATGTNSFATGVAVSSGGLVDNSGIITADDGVSGQNATGVGLWNGGTLDNLAGGYIGATGQYALGVSVGGLATIMNFGEISATASGGSNATGVQFDGYGNSAETLMNYGTLIATGGRNTNGVVGQGVVVNEVGASIYVNGGQYAAGINLWNGGAATNAGSITVVSSYNYATGVNVGNSGSITNSGAVTVTGNKVTGLVLANGGTVSNSGTVTANSGVSGQGPTGVGLWDGGTLYNVAGGRIIANGNDIPGNYANGVSTGGMAAMIVNQGYIGATGNGESGIWLGAGGVVTNDGEIETSGIDASSVGLGSAYSTLINNGSIGATGNYISGVFVQNGGTIDNNEGGSITATGSSVSAINGGYSYTTIDNAGAINSSGGAAIWLGGGGDVNNSASGDIASTGVHIAAVGLNTTGQVTNAGYIGASGGQVSGVYLGNGGAVTNTGTIEITTYGAGVLSISKSTVAKADGSGVNLNNGGALVNEAGGTIIADGSFLSGVYALAYATETNDGAIEVYGYHVSGMALENGGVATNSGSIVAKTDAGGHTSVVRLAHGGSFTNEASGTITGSGSHVSGVYMQYGGGTATNYGSISIDVGTAGNASGVQFGTAGGAFINAAGATDYVRGEHVSAVYSKGAATDVTNSGLISVVTIGSIYGANVASSSGADVRLAHGGTVTNTTGGSITGSGADVVGVALGMVGTLNNAGSIALSGTADSGVYLQNGGSVDNTGTIEVSGANAAGVILANGGTATNEAGALISTSGAGSAALEAWNGGAIVNAGTIEAASAVSSGTAVDLEHGATLNNSGTITFAATYNASAVVVEYGGGVTNSGSIVDSGINSCGIYAGNGSATVTNSGSISIDVTNGAGVYLSSGGTVTNSGNIAAVGTGTSGVSLHDGGALTNQIGGSIDGGAGAGVVANGPAAANIVNAGSISGDIASVQFLGAGANTLTLQTGSTLSGAVLGSTVAGASNALILQGTGVANNDFDNFNTLTVDADANWTLGGALSGAIVFESAGSLDLGAADGENISLANADRLEFGADYTGTISGFGADDSVEYLSAVYSDDDQIVYNANAGNTGGTLTVENGLTTVVAIAVSGAYTASDFEVSGAEGTDDLVVSSTQTDAAVNPVQTSTYNLVPGVDPITFGAGTNIDVEAGSAVYGSAGLDWRVTNNGELAAAGDDASGVLFEGDGVIDNTGEISVADGQQGAGVRIDGFGAVTNSGSITASGNHVSGVGLYGGGSVTNTNTGTIAASGSYVSGVFLNLGGTVNNFGVISAPGNDAVFGWAGGTVNNYAGGKLEGGWDGVYLSGGVETVINSGAISGVHQGIELHAYATVTNSGTVIVNSGPVYQGSVGVGLWDGGVLNNLAGGRIVGNGNDSVGNYPSGVGTGGAAAFITNAGYIGSTGFGASGIWLGDGGSVVNESGGVIDGTGTETDGVGFGAGGALVNDGSIGASGSNLSGVFLQDGGTIANDATGKISALGSNVSAIYAVQGYIDVMNAGLITDVGATGGGSTVWLNGGGDVVNQTTGVITGSGSYDSIVGLGGYGKVANAGYIGGSGDHISGVFLNQGGAVTNSGKIEIETAGAGAYGIGGSNADTHGAGVNLNSGGSFVNEAGGTVIANGSYVSGVYAKTAATLSNLGEIEVYGYHVGAMVLQNGGSATNAGSLVAKTDVGGHASIVRLGNGGDFTNEASGTIVGSGNHVVGVYLQAGGGAATNEGSISISVSGPGHASGVQFGTGGGSFDNAAHASVYVTGAYVTGSYSLGAATTVTNSGLISIVATGVGHGSVVRLVNGGTVTNEVGGTMTGAGAHVNGVTFNHGGVLNNYGALDVVGNNNIGAYLQNGGLVTNTGTILVTGANTIGVDFANGNSSLTNSGTIGGSTASVEFAGSGPNALTLQTGSILEGAAVGSTAAGATNALILEGTGTANNAFGNFNTLTVDDNADWTLGGVDSFGQATVGDDAVLTDGSGVTISTTAGSGFAAMAVQLGSYATLTNSGAISATGGNYSDGVAGQGPSNSVTNAAGGTINVHGGDDATGVGLWNGGTVANYGSVNVFSSGIYASGVFVGGGGAVVNSGSVTVSGDEAGGVNLGDGGSIDNEVGGEISASGNGATAASLWEGGALVNAGAISSTATGQGGGAVTLGHGATLNNSGSIDFAGTFNASAVVALYGGSVANSGSIVDSGTNSCGVYTGYGSATVTNTGLISIDVTNGAGVYLNDGGTVTNSGSITAAGTGISGVGLGDGGTVNNQAGGTIDGGSGTGVSAKGAGDANIVDAGAIIGVAASIEFAGSGSNTLTLQTGAILNGAVIGSTATGATNALILQGTGIADNVFDNFSTVTIDANSDWTLSGTSTFGQALVSGDDASLTLDGTIATALVSGADDVFTTSSSNTFVSVTGAGDAVSIGGSDDTVTAIGSNDAFTFTGASAAFTLNANNASLNITGGDDVVTVNGADDVITFSDPGANLTLIDPSDTVKIAGANDSVNLSASGDNVELTANNVDLTGSGDNNHIVISGATTTANVDVVGQGNTISIADTAADIAADLDSLNANNSISSIILTDPGVPVLAISIEQALNDKSALAKISTPHTVALADTAANIASITLAQANSVKAAGYTTISSTTGAVVVSIAEGQILLSAGLSVSNATVTVAGIVTAMTSLSLSQASAFVVAGYSLGVIDTAADIEALTKAQITTLAGLMITKIMASDASLSLSAAQAIAFETAHIALSAPHGGVTITDTATNLQALTASQIAALTGAGIAEVVSNNGALKFTVAQTLALEAAGVTVSAVGAAVTVSDSASNLETLTAAEIALIPHSGFSGVVATNTSVVLTLAQAAAFEAIAMRIAVPSGAKITITDTGADVTAMSTSLIAGLPAIGVTAIAASGAGVTLSVAQANALEAAGVGLSVPSGDTVVISDAAANLATLTVGEIGALAALHVTQLQASDTGVTLNVAQADALETAKITLTAPAGDSASLVDTAADIVMLTTTEIASLSSTLHVSSVKASDASLSLSVAQAIAFETAHIALSAPHGGVTITDTATNLQALTASQIAALTGAGIAEVVSNNVALKFTVAQTLALEAAGVTVSAVGAAVTVSDSASNLETLTAGEIALLPGMGFSAVVATNTSVVLTLTQAAAFEAIATKIAVPSGAKITIADTGADVAAMSTSLIAGLPAIGVTAIAASGAGVTLSVAQANALEAAGVGLSVPSGDLVVISDTATHLASLSVAQIGALAALHVTQLQASDTGVTLSVAQADALETAKITLTAPAGYSASVVDSASDIATLTTTEIASLNATLHVSSLAATGSALSLSVAQAIAFEAAHIALSAPGGGVTVADTANNLQALTAAEIAALKGAGIAEVVSNSGALKFTVAQTIALEAAGVTVSAGTAAVTVSDTAANLETLTAAEIALIPQSGFSGVVATNTSVVLTLTQAAAFEAIATKIAVPSGAKITITDTGADVTAMTLSLIAGLPAIGVTAIAASGAGVTLSVAQANALETAGVGLSVPSGDTVVISDSAADLASLTVVEIGALAALHVTQLQASDTGVTLSVAQADALETAKITLTAPAGDSASLLDTAVAIGTLTTTEIASLSTTLHVSSVAATDASLALTVAQAIAFETAHIALSAPGGDVIVISDTAAHLQALTAAEITALTGEGELFSTNANVSYSAAQTAVIGAAGLLLGATGSDTVTENFSNGDYSVYESNALIAQKTVNADGSYEVAHFDVSGLAYSSYQDLYSTNGTHVAEAQDLIDGTSGSLQLLAGSLTVSSGPSSFEVTTGDDTFTLNPHMAETIVATGKTMETFTYSGAFGHSSISGFAATGSDVIQLQESAFNYLLSSATQSQDAAAVLSHAAQSGANLVITDSVGDTLTLDGISKTTLLANTGDFKFV